MLIAKHPDAAQMTVVLATLIKSLSFGSLNEINPVEQRKKQGWPTSAILVEFEIKYTSSYLQQFENLTSLIGKR